MSPHRNLFVEFSENSSIDEVCQGDDSPLKVEGVGKIVMFADTGYEIIFENVLYVPRLATTLISLGKLTLKNFTLTFQEAECKVIKNNDLIIEGIIVGDVYRLKEGKESAVCKCVRGEEEVVGVAYKVNDSIQL